MNAILAMSLSVNIFYFKPKLNFEKAKKKNVISFHLCFQLSKLQSDHGNLESDKTYSDYIFHTGNPLSAPPAYRINLHAKRVVLDCSIYMDCFVFQGGHIRLSAEYSSRGPGNKPYCSRYG